MSGKPSHVSRSNDDPPPRPIALLCAVVFAAAVSTWHWYRPLPKKAAALAGGPFVAESEPHVAKQAPQRPSRWQEAGLIFPSEDPGEIEPKTEERVVANGPERDGLSNDSTNLTGKPDLALQPFRASNQPLDQSISQIALPMVPVPLDSPLSVPTPAEARLWNITPNQTTNRNLLDDKIANAQLSSSGTHADSASPFRASGPLTPKRASDSLPQEPSRSLKTDIWPDQGFDPRTSTVMPSSKSTEKSPDHSGLLSLSSNRIRTLDQEPAPKLTPKPKASDFDSIQPGIAREFYPPDPKALIRQPLPKGTVSK